MAEVGPLGPIPQVVEAAGETDAVQVVGRVLAARPPLEVPALHVAAGGLVAARGVPSTIAVPQGLDARHGGVLANVLVAQARPRRVLGLPALAGGASAPTVLGPLARGRPGVRVPRQAAGRSRTTRPGTLPSIGPSEGRPARGQVGPTFRRMVVRVALVVRRVLRPMVEVDAMGTGLAPILVPAGVATILPAVVGRPAMGRLGHAIRNVVQATAEVAVGGLLEGPAVALVLAASHAVTGPAAVVGGRVPFLATAVRPKDTTVLPVLPVGRTPIAAARAQIPFRGADGGPPSPATQALLPATLDGHGPHVPVVLLAGTARVEVPCVASVAGAT